MKIDEAVTNLRKLINCRCSIYCREHCVYCENHVPQIERIASMEKVIEYIEGRINGETMEKKMTKGQQIEYAIFKAVSEYSFVDWLETWGIEEEDWDKFMDAGKAALPKPDQVTNRDLIDFCNDMGGLCEVENCAYYEECNTYESTYGYIPFAENTLHPERYTDEVIVIEESDEDGD